jgi:hypothetical protein
MCPGPWSLCRARPVFFAVVISGRISAVVPPFVPPFSTSSVLFSFTFPLFVLAQFVEYDARCNELEATEYYHLSQPKNNRLIRERNSRQKVRTILETGRVRWRLTSWGGKWLDE